MLPKYDDFLIKRFEQPDEVRAFEKGKFRDRKDWIDIKAGGKHVYTEAFNGKRAWQWKGEGD